MRNVDNSIYNLKIEYVKPIKMQYYKQEKFIYEIKRRKDVENNRKEIKQEFEDIILDSTTKTNKVKDELATSDKEFRRYGKTINMKKYENSKLKMKLDDIKKSNYKFKDTLYNKTFRNRDVFKLTSNLKTEIYKKKSAITLKEETSKEMNNLNKTCNAISVR